MNALVTLRGAGDLDAVDVMELDDESAGLVFLTALVAEKPDLTWAELERFGRQFNASGTMGFSLTKIAKGIGRGTSDLVSKTGKVLGDVVNITGKKAGEAVRLVSDPQVADTIARGATAYASGGSSEGIKGVFEQIGAAFKNVAAGGGGSGGGSGDSKLPEWVLPVSLGAGGLVLLALLVRR